MTNTDKSNLIDSPSATLLVPEYHVGTSKSHVDRFDTEYVKLWENFEPKSRVCLLTTCSHAKPYAKSYIHMKIRERLYDACLLDQVQIVHVTNAGLIPEQFSDVYPFCAYDWDDRLATQEERMYYVERAKVRLENLMALGLFDTFVTYFNPDDDNLIYLNDLKGIANIAVERKDALPWEVDPDVDTCLTAVTNLNKLVGALVSEIASSNTQDTPQGE